MVRILGVDVETCSAADISNGAAPYAEHETTRVHCAVFALSTGASDVRVFRWTPGYQLPQPVADHIIGGGAVLAHNAQFEQCIFNRILSPLFNVHIRTEQWVDTMMIAGAVNLPLGLGALARTLRTTAQKSKEGHKLMLSLSTVERGPHGWIYPVVSPQQLDELVEYCEYDVRSMIDCFWILPRLVQEEYAMMVVDRRINTRGALLDQELAAAMGKMTELRSHAISEEVFDETNDLIGVGSVQGLGRWLKREGVAVGTSLDRAAIATILAKLDLPETVRSVLEKRIEAGRVTSLAKAAKVPRVVTRDGRLRYALRYCGAHTGRWSSKGLQLHNLARATPGFKAIAPEFSAAVRAGDIVAAAKLYPDVLEGLSFLLRSLVIAPPGLDIIGGDFAGIEARGMSWVAGFTEKLDVFRRYDRATGDDKKKLDPYVVAAARIGSDNRQLGKICELALQYGMGAIKFRDTAVKAGVQLSLKEACKIQLAWRKANKPIVDFWHRIQDAVAETLELPGSPVFVGQHIMVIGSKECLRIVLPSGRSLYYWGPHQRDVVREIETVNEEGEIVKDLVKMRELRFLAAEGSGMVVESTYGGKLTENIVQALSRDVLRDALLRFDSSKQLYNVVLHVHDSIAAEVPQGFGSVEEFCATMAVPPVWALDMPIAVDGYRARHFKG